MNIDKGIYWKSWNPFTGCTPVGPACDNCWAKRMAYRFRGRFGYPADDPFRPTFHPERLSRVNPNQKPRAIALCFMSDPFHEEHSHMDITNMLDRIEECSQHTFIGLTKRPERMEPILRVHSEKPIPNLIGGVSIWDQESADRMIPILLQTNLAKRVVSVESCLGMVDLHLQDNQQDTLWRRKHGGSYERKFIDGVILGGESGPGARPMHPDWARSVRDQCQLAGVDFFLKSLGQGKGRLLDGRTCDDLPW